VPITYSLRTLDNEDVGTFATTLSDWRPGAELTGHGNRQFRIVAIEEDVDLFWVEPVEAVQVRDSV
jgi:DUF971 family protein